MCRLGISCTVQYRFAVDCVGLFDTSMHACSAARNMMRCILQRLHVSSSTNLVYLYGIFNKQSLPTKTHADSSTCYIGLYLIRQRIYRSHLKKSSRQNSWPSREKHLSVRGHLQSEHWTQLMCQTRSSTFNKNRSSIGPSHPAHISSMVGVPSRCTSLSRWRSLARSRFLSTSLYLGFSMTLGLLAWRTDWTDGAESQPADHWLPRHHARAELSIEQRS